jgi:hypothetical protein
VILCDAYDVIIRIWKYLQQAKPEDILRLPDVKDGQPIPLQLCDEEKWLMGFCVNRGSAQPKLSASRFNDWARDRESISKQVHKIRHWNIARAAASYDSLGNARATWFIDPPYQGQMGNYYKHHEIDYGQLADWCKSRWGESIVCENAAATWLPFAPIAAHDGSMRRTTEAIWHSNPSLIQGNLFAKGESTSQWTNTSRTIWKP